MPSPEDEKKNLPEDSHYEEPEEESDCDDPPVSDGEETVISPHPPQFLEENHLDLTISWQKSYRSPVGNVPEDTPPAVETVLRGETLEGSPVKELLERYTKLTASGSLAFSENLHLVRLLGSGGQGRVYLSYRQGVDRFKVPVAFKFFSPSTFASVEKYLAFMANHAKVAAIVNQIQQDNLLNVHNWRHIQGIRVMEMEWVDGYDLNRLMTYRMYDWLKENLPENRWKNMKKVVVTEGITRPRLKSGIVMKIIRDCLNALSVLHEHHVIHGDIKCSNIMLKRTGSAKIIDIGGAFLVTDKSPLAAYTPHYAAPEVLDPAGGTSAAGNHRITGQSDLASLGYVMIELLSGCYLFGDIPQNSSYTENLLAAKRRLADNLQAIFPNDVWQDKLLVDFCRRLTHHDLSKRFVSAQDAILGIGGLADVIRQLMRGDLVSEFDFDIRSWISSLDEWE